MSSTNSIDKPRSIFVFFNTNPDVTICIIGIFTSDISTLLGLMIETYDNNKEKGNKHPLGGAGEK